MSDSNTYPEPQSLPIGIAAHELGVTVATVRNWDEAGKIASFRTPGGQRRIPVEEIERIKRPQSCDVQPTEVNQ